MEFADFIEANDSFDWACRLPNNHAMNKQHPAITAYERLCKQEPNRYFLDFALLQQAWLRERGASEQCPSDYALALLRAMSYGFLLSQGFAEHEVREQLVDAMTSFEKGHARLANSISARDDRPMKRTRWLGKVIPLFSGNNGGNRQ